MFGKVGRQRRSTLAILGALGVIVVLTAVVAGGAQAAKPDPQNAKACQKGGWMDLVRSDGTSFASERECRSYARQGGTLHPKPATAQSICEDAGGNFATGGTSSTTSEPLLWSCNGISHETYFANNGAFEQAFRDQCLVNDRGSKYWHVGAGQMGEVVNAECFA